MARSQCWVAYERNKPCPEDGRWKYANKKCVKTCKYKPSESVEKKGGG